MVVHHRRCTVLVAGPYLGQVLEAGDQRDAVPSTGGRQDIELLERCDGGRLVEDHEEWLVESPTLAPSEVERLPEHSARGGGEQGLEPALLVGGRTEVEGAALAEELGRIEGTGDGIDRHHQRIKDGLERGVHRAELTLVSGQRCTKRVQRPIMAMVLEDLPRLTHGTAIDPADDGVQFGARGRGRKEQGGEQLGGQLRPERHLSRDRRLVRWCGQIHRHRSSGLKRGRQRHRIKAGPELAVRCRGVDHEAGPLLASPGGGLADEVILDRGGHDRALPGEQRRHHQR